jgi:hypothetical protein
VSASASKTPTQDFVVALPVPMHQALQDEAIRRSRAGGKRVHMTDVAREAIDRELKRSASRSS